MNWAIKILIRIAVFGVAIAIYTSVYREPVMPDFVLGGVLFLVAHFVDRYLDELGS